ncbi:MAG: methyltransferase [Clostridia bacterium]|nr:methyltransferase [Clostridia bacterium]
MKEIIHEVNEHIKLIQNPDGLTFGTDAYLLSAYVRPKKGGIAVDLGSGTGIIPLLCLARNKAARFTAVEIQPSFCDLITRNAALNGMADRLTAHMADVRDLRAVDLGGEADIVTANPPYMAPASGARNTTDEKYIARHEVCGTVADFCAAAGRLLKHGGRFCCVFRPERLSDLFAGLRAAHLEPKRMTMVQATYAALPSMVLVEAVKYAAPSLLVTPPLCLWEADPENPEKPAVPMVQTPDAAYIYENCGFPPKFTGENRNR